MLTESEATAAACIEAYQRFMCHIWFHDLITPETDAAREQGLAEFNGLLFSMGLQGRPIIGVPVGSIRTIFGERSDFDFRVMTWTLNDAEAFNGILPRMNGQVGRLGIIGPAYPVKTDFLTPTAASLFITPDRYIAGSIGCAQEARLGLIKRMDNREVGIYWERIAHYFKRYYIEWRRNRTAEKGFVTSKREDRFWETLITKAKKEDVPAAFIECVYARLETLVLPDMATIRTAILATKGALGIG